MVFLSISRVCERIFPWVFGLLIVLIAATPADLDMDLGWQIAQGRWMVQHGAFYRTDELNYPNLHQPTIDEYPIFQFIVYGASLLGPVGTTVLRVVLCLAFFLLFFEIARRFPPGKGDVLLPAALLITSFLLDYSLRAQWISLIFLSIFVLYLTRYQQAPHPIKFWPLYVLQILWVNIHSGFILGPITAVCLGFEAIFSNLLKGIISKQQIYSWCLIWLTLSFVSLINPYGSDRLSLPFYQNNLALIRTYVPEMQPLTGPALGRAYSCVECGVALVIVGRFCFGLRLSIGVVAVALILLKAADSTAKYWPFFIILIPLVILCSYIRAHEEQVEDDKSDPPLPALGALMMMTVVGWTISSVISVLPSTMEAWRSFDNDHSSQPTAATVWMQSHQINGRIMNRAEIGGWLQQHGAPQHGPGWLTYCDAGLGKFSPEFISQITLIGQRPGVFPLLLKKNPADAVVTGFISHDWSARLRNIHYRLVFYSVNSSVWLPPDTHPELPEISAQTILATYKDQYESLSKGDLYTFCLSLIDLHGAGCPQEAADFWKARPSDFHLSNDYWQMVQLMCSDSGAWDLDRAAQFATEATQIDSVPGHDIPQLRLFLALDHFWRNDDAAALAILEKLPLSHEKALLKLKILIRTEKWDDALSLSQQPEQFDQLDGEYWQCFAEVQDHFHHDGDASIGWSKAIQYAPDSPHALDEAKSFAQRTNNQELLTELEKWD